VTEHPPCAICASPGSDYAFGLEGQKVRRCIACGLLHVDPLDGHGIALSSASNSLNGPRLGACLAEILAYHQGERTRLLAVGPALEPFLAAAKAAGFDALGAESLPPAGEGAFDACVLIDALGLGPDPLGLLAAAHRCLRPGGTLFVVTPGAESQRACLYYFDLQNLQNALAKAGFEAMRAGSLSVSLLARPAALRPRPLLSVVVPVYNEVATFPVLMKALLAKQIAGLDMEVIVIESGSSDGTRALVQDLERQGAVRALYEQRPQGKGHAVRLGLKAAQGDWILIQDGDLEYDVDDYDALLAPLMAYQSGFVLGSRHLGDWKMRKYTDQPVAAVVLNLAHLFFTFLLNSACGSKLKDPFTMFKVFRRDCLYGLEFKANRFDFDFELMIKLLRKGYQPLEVPVNYRSRSFKEGKKVRLFYDPLTWIWALIRFRVSPLYKK
jgi:SAM-dependent methyltransferase